MTKKDGLVIAALGVVFGDIGTSPLYALKECFSPHYGIGLTEGNILGICSLIFWSLTLVIVGKYISFIIKADNEGEGGILSLLSLIKTEVTPWKIPFIVVMGLFGTALLYGDGIITPAISVLSAVEGITIVAPHFNEAVVPITLAILLALFLVQKYGTQKIGYFFGPILLVWFGTLFLLGAYWVFQNPHILVSVNPYYGYKFFLENSTAGFLVLGSVVLVVTGGEALYADLGHFGRKPITKAWFYFVYPSLVLNYLGQGSLLLTKGQEVVSNPFFKMVDGVLIYPLLVIATLATIIASQALITGVYSLTQQAMRLGYLPRLTIKHTSRDEQGQIYIPKANFALMIGCLLLVLTLKESSKLAAAYGIAVTGTMVFTTILFFFVAKQKWKWSWYQSIPLVLAFLVLDFAFLGANLVKIAHGGWIPLAISVVIFWVMTTWKKGRLLVFDFIKNNSEPLSEFVDSIKDENVYRNPGTAIFMTMNKNIAPYSLVNNLKHNNVIHEKVAILTISTEKKPEVKREDKVQVEILKNNFYIIHAHYGFMEMPDVQEILKLAAEQGFTTDMSTTSFFLGKEFIVPTGNSSMWIVSKKLFKILNANNQSALDFFKIPQDRVIEIGGQVKI